MIRSKEEVPIFGIVLKYETFAFWEEASGNFKQILCESVIIIYYVLTDFSR